MKIVITALNLRFGIGCIRDDNKAEEFCLLACSEGSKLALGMKHLFGWKTETDNKKAFQIFNQTSEESIKDDELKYSYFLLGRCYHNGEGIVDLF